MNKNNNGGLRTKSIIKENSHNDLLISIVTVALNSKEYIEKTIMSIINQTYNNIEYIIIDGGSTDGTIEIIKKYEDNIDFWISEPDKGIYDAMNKGIDLSTGKWINFMNAGDQFYDTGTVEKIFSSYSDDKDLIYGDHMVIYNNISLIKKAKKIKDIYKGMIFCHQSLFAKKELYDKHKFNLRYQIASDYNFIIRSFKDRNKMFYIGIPIATISSYGISDKNRIKTVLEYWKISKKYSDNYWINIYYLYLIIFVSLKLILKDIIPIKLQEYLRIIINK